MAKITLDGATFAKGEDAKRYLLGKMNGYPLNKPIPDIDVPLWFDVLQRHEWFEEYVDHGIHHFIVTPSDQRPNLRNMAVVNDRGERRPFSYQKYLTRGSLTKLAKVKAALRTEIEPQIAGHRKPGQHVHHDGKPFLQIVDEFLLANLARWYLMETEAAGSTGYRLRDRGIAAEWAEFHRTHAILATISPEENLKAGAGGYRMQFKEIPPCPVPLPPA